MTEISLPVLSITKSNNRRIALRWLARATRPLRHGFNPRRWPVEWRALIGLATADELTVLERVRQAIADQRALEKQLDALAVAYKRLIINALTRVGVSYMYQDDGRRKFSQVQFRKPAMVTREAIYYRVKTERLPFHISINALLEESICDTLSASTGRVVSVHWNRYRPEDGCWIIVELRAGVRGIPRHVDYSDMLEGLPADAPPLTVPIGCGVAGAKKYDDLADMPHLLIGGATKQGKSVWMKQALMTLLLRNSPNRLKLIMIDLKGGVELGQFKRVPHLLVPVIKENERVVDALQHAVRECKSRLKRFEERGVVDIKQWNRKGGHKLDYWIIIIDELASLMLDDEIKNDVDRLLGFLAAQGRAPGVHVVAATQRPEARVVTGLIKANFTARLAFACADYASSKVILDTADASGIGPAGRMIYFTGKEKLELQGPWVSPSLVDDTVLSIVGGQSGDALERRKRHNFSPEDFFRYALNHYDGVLKLDPLWESFKIHGVSNYELRQIFYRYDNEEFELDGAIYKVVPPTKNGMDVRPRRLVQISAPADENDVDKRSIDGATDGYHAIDNASLDNFQPIEVVKKTRVDVVDGRRTGAEAGAGPTEPATESLTMICPNCNSANADGTTECVQCSAP